MGLCSLEAGGSRLTLKNRGQVRVSVHNLRVGVMRAAKIIIGKSEAGTSHGDGKVWELAKAIADRTWEGVPWGCFSQMCFKPH